MDSIDCYNIQWEKPAPVLGDPGYVSAYTYLWPEKKVHSLFSRSLSLHAEITGGFNFILLYRFSNLSLISNCCFIGGGSWRNCLLKLPFIMVKYT